MSDTDRTGLVTLLRLTEEEARAKLEAMRWPDGAICPHCGVIGNAAKVESKADATTRAGLWQCLACHKQFSVTVGTAMEGSHIPLAKWIAAVHLLCSSKKSVSALQVQRQLELGSYRTAWHLCHRIRHMFANSGPLPPLSGDVEADETWVGGKPRKRGSAATTKQRQAVHRAWRKKLVPVAVLVSRDGKARVRVMKHVTGKQLRAFVLGNVDVKNSRLLTDEFKAYRSIGKKFGKGHESVSHKAGEYARGDVHSNTAESFHSLFKRSYHGSWHHVSREHISRYLDEQAFRWSHKKTTDWQRTMIAMSQAGGVRLYYKIPRRQAQQGGQSLVAGA